jgi:hypothetical protein
MKIDSETEFTDSISAIEFLKECNNNGYDYNKSLLKGKVRPTIDSEDTEGK